MAGVCWRSLARPLARRASSPEQMQAALVALDQAVAQEDADRKAAAAETGGPGQGKSASESDHVGLRQRVLPFVEMLKSCVAAGEDIRWGV